MEKAKFKVSVVSLNGLSNLMWYLHLHSMENYLHLYCDVTELSTIVEHSFCTWKITEILINNIEHVRKNGLLCLCVT